MKKKLHIHSDNSEWAGCENMPGIFLQSNLINKEFDVTFSYRESKNYESGFFKWVGYFRKDRDYPLTFWVTYLYKIRKYFKLIMALKYLAMLNEVYKLYRLFKRIKPDILHINNGGYPGATSCNSAVIAGRLAKIPKITYMINSTITCHWHEKPITYFIRKYVDCFITASEHLRNIVINNLVSKGWNQTKVIPNTVLKRKVINRDLVRSQFDCTENDILFLCCGNLEKRKGFDNIINTFNKIERENKYDNFKLVIYGDGPEQNALMNSAKAWDIFFYNKSTKYDITIDSYSMINACDVLLVPSIADEDFPNVLLIAQMFGRFCIGTELAGIPEILDNWKFSETINIWNIYNEFEFCIREIINEYYKKIKNPELEEIIKQNFENKYGNELILNKYINMWNN